MSTSENIFGQKITKNIEENVFETNSNETNEDYSAKVGDAINQFIKVIDIDDLSPEELLRIIVAVGSKNMSYYLALIVNFENRSRKISPLGIAKILSSKSVNAPNSNPIKNTFTADAITRNKDLNKS